MSIQNRSAVRPLASTVILVCSLGVYVLDAAAAQTMHGSTPLAAMAEQGGTVESGRKRGNRLTLSAVQFNPALLNGKVADINSFTHGNPVPAGAYTVELIINGRSLGQHDVEFVDVPDSDVAEPCFTLARLAEFGVDIARISRQRPGEPDSGPAADDGPSAPLGNRGETVGADDQASCLQLSHVLPDAAVAFDSADLKLDLTIPQASMKTTPEGYVDPALWNSGINAGLLQYNFNNYTSNQNGVDFSSAYLGLQLGINLGQWRFRQRSTLNWQNRQSGMRWNNVATYVERDLTSLRSRLTLGDSFTTGDIFDSFSVRGVQVSTEDRMLPDSMRAYAPLVRGVAESNARVIVRQNNNIIYETSVPPGPFELADLPATGYGGDMQVTVDEADGRRQTFSVPFAAVPQLLRPGISRFNLTAGQYRDQLLRNEPWVGQATVQRGLTDMLTAYTGILASEGYRSGLLGLAVNTPIGAVAADFTLAHTDLRNGTHRGGSWRVSYSKRVPRLDTNLVLGAYRYSTSGFYSLRDAAYARQVWEPPPDVASFRTRNRLQLNINQPVGRIGSLYLSGSTQDYWDGRRGRDIQYQAGLTGGYRRISYTIYAQQSYDQNRSKQTQVGLNLSISLGRDSSIDRGPFDTLATNMMVGTHGDSALQANLSGSTFGDSPVSYGMNALRSTSADSHTASVGGYTTARTRYGTYSANASVGNNMRQFALNADGSMVGHAGGVTLGPPLGMAAALVEAKGAEGGRIINGQGARIDGNGYALLPTLTPYRMNKVAIDPTDLPDDVELMNTSEEVAPRLNSLILVKMPTARGEAVLVTLHDEHGEPLPLGTGLFDADGMSLGNVGQGGLAFLRGLAGKGVMRAKWGMGADESCDMPYSVPTERTDGAGANDASRLTLRCDASAT
ncbi:fimbria/pilus outer membrane usher protein [Cupriavidus campinensis]